jgi:hypothetical protein
MARVILGGKVDGRFLLVPGWKESFVDTTCSAFYPDSSQVFFELLQNLPWEGHIHIFTGVPNLAQRLQDDFGRAMKKTREDSMSF